MKMATPVKFNAGGKSPKKKNGAIPSQKSLVNSGCSDNIETIANHQMKKEEEVEATKVRITHNNMEWIQAGLHKKRSPLSIKNWIVTVLTLDGRDKFTKVLQYSSRLLCWYFAVLASRRTTTAATGGGDVTGLISKEKELYQAISTRFNSLYKSLVTSRKAFRMGRSVIEWEKIKSMGWGDYLGYLLRHPLEEGGANALTRSGDGCCDGECPRPLLERFDTHPIPEEDEREEEGDDENKSWISDEKDAIVEEKKDDSPLEKNKKVVSRPGRPALPSRISSNIGWRPMNTTEDTSSSSESHHIPPTRAVTEMGRQMYRPQEQLKTSSSTLSKSTPSSPPTPAWKLIGGTLKLLGLMGFWAFDNMSFLTTSGFLDPFQGDAKSHAVIRTSRKKRASEYAARCYFTGCLAGLYVNIRSFWIHRNGALADARREYHSAAATSSDKKEEDGASLALKKVEQKHFELFLALLKSVCDVTVFSNNPGIDLHLKLRGKKNHEGFHCLCGLISASTVLYNNFPNAE